MSIWFIGYIAFGLASVTYAAWSNARQGDEVDVNNAFVAGLIWPVFAAIVVGEMIVARNQGGDKP